MATTSVMYPKGVKFDMDYYLKTHMPLVGEKWTPLGLKSWKIVECDDEAPYKVVAILEWGSMDDFKSAGSSPTAKEVFGDIPNFSDKQPVVMAGPVVGSS